MLQHRFPPLMKASLLACHPSQLFSTQIRAKLVNQLSAIQKMQQANDYASREIITLLLKSENDLKSIRFKEFTQESQEAIFEGVQSLVKSLSVSPPLFQTSSAAESIP